MKLKDFVVAAAILTASAVPAAANTITAQWISTIDQGNGTWLWTYQANLQNGQLVNNQSFFTLYDIYGLIAGSATSSPAIANTSWNANVALTGQTPVSVGFPPADAPTKPNLTFTYSSLTPYSSNPSVLLGTFTFLSTVGRVGVGQFTSQDIARIGPPVAQPNGAAAIEITLPDGGSTVAFLGSVLFAFGLLGRRLGLR